MNPVRSAVALFAPLLLAHAAISSPASAAMNFNTMEGSFYEPATSTTCSIDVEITANSKERGHLTVEIGDRADGTSCKISGYFKALCGLGETSEHIRGVRCSWDGQGYAGGGLGNTQFLFLNSQTLKAEISVTAEEVPTLIHRREFPDN